MSRQAWILLGQLSVLSGLISVGIKYGAPALPIPATIPVVVAFIVSPTLLLGILLWRWQHQDPDS